MLNNQFGRTRIADQENAVVQARARLAVLKRPATAAVTGVTNPEPGPRGLTSI